MNVDISHNDGIATAAISGHLDSSNVQDFEVPLLEAIGKGDKYILIDFKDCSFLSSAGIRVILIAAKKVGEASGKLVMTGMNEYINEVFTISGLQAILTIIQDREKALTELRSAAKS